MVDSRDREKICEKCRNVCAIAQKYLGFLLVGADQVRLYITSTKDRECRTSCSLNDLIRDLLISGKSSCILDKVGLSSAVRYPIYIQRSFCSHHGVHHY